MAVTQFCAGIGCRLKDYIDTSNVLPVDVDEFENSRSLSFSKPGSNIFCQHDPSTGIYCIRSGHVLLSHVDAFEHETAFRIVGPGEIIGHRSFFGDDVHAATAEALTACHICWHPGATVHHLIHNYPVLARRFLKELAHDRGAPDALLLRSTHLPVYTRLAQLLLMLKDQCADRASDTSVKFDLPLSRRQIAVLLGARPESVARAIKKLKRDGIAHFKGRHIAIPDQHRLSELVPALRREHGHTHARGA